MLEPRFAEEVVDGTQGHARVGGQGLVLHQQQAITLCAVAGLLEGVIRAADQSVGGDDGVGAGVDRPAGRIVEDRRGAENVALGQLFDAADDPGHVADAGDDLGFGEQSGDGRHPPAPGPAGVEDDLGGAVGVVVVEQSVQDALALGVVDEDRKLVTTPPARWIPIGADPR